MRSVVRWYGGKGNMVAKLLRHVPDGGRPYCEPYMGGASLFFARRPAPVEVLNDLRGDLVNLFRCLQDPKTFPELAHRIRYTLYSRAEFARAIAVLNSDERDPVLRAWAMFVASNQGMSAKHKAIGDWGRVIRYSSQGISSTNNAWLMRLFMLADWHRRLLMV
jgi:DNA adenine methylase